MKLMKYSKFMRNGKKRNFPISFPKPNLRSTTPWKCYQKRKKLKRLNNRMKRIRSAMEEISEEQKEIKVCQKQVREKFEAIELECKELRNETNFIVKQSARTQTRLAFMFQILKARENLEFDKANMLTSALREVITREEQEIDASK